MQQPIIEIADEAHGMASAWVLKSDAKPDVIRALLSTQDAAIVTASNDPNDKSFGIASDVIVGCNSTWCDLCGFKPEEAIGKSPKLLQGEDTDAKVARVFTDRVSDESGESDCALINYAKSGRRFLHHLHAKRLDGLDKKCSPPLPDLCLQHMQGMACSLIAMLTVHWVAAVGGDDTCTALAVADTLTRSQAEGPDFADVGLVLSASLLFFAALLVCLNFSTFETESTSWIAKCVAPLMQMSTMSEVEFAGVVSECRS
uniref:PAS domain-containing protein n=1 Tax=Chrysotila carterae TaxID=13221 RepID=A0A7S4C706_CHRCT